MSLTEQATVLGIPNEHDNVAGVAGYEQKPLTGRTAYLPGEKISMIAVGDAAKRASNVLRDFHASRGVKLKPADTVVGEMVAQPGYLDQVAARKVLSVTSRSAILEKQENEAKEAELDELRALSAQLKAGTAPTGTAQPAPVAQPVAPPSVAAQPVAKPVVAAPLLDVDLQLEIGDFSVKAIEVLEHPNGIVLIVPLGASIFKPKEGTILTVSYDDKKIECYSIGSFVESTYLKAGIITLLKEKS